MNDNPWPRRIAALVVSTLMVVAALAVRARIDDDGDDSSGSGGHDDGSATVVVCIRELREACAALADDGDVEVLVEDAGTTAEELGALADADAADADAWVTYAPWAEIVRDTRGRAGSDDVLGDDVALARSPLVFAARADRAAVLQGSCGSEVTWSCLGTAAGQAWSAIGGEETWGRVRPAHAEPVTSANGMLAVGHAVGSFLAGPDVTPDEVSRIDWEASDEFPGWFQALERAIPEDAFRAGRDPFASWLQTRLTAFDVVATTEADATTALARAAGDVRDSAALLYPAPVATADVVIVPVGDAEADTAVRDALLEALTERGWRVEGSDPPAGAPSLPDTDGLPAPGALDALRGLWEEVAG